MPGAARLGDIANCPLDSHGCVACAHNATGPIVQGSKDVDINGKPAAFVGCRGIHGVCCGPNTFEIAVGAPSVFINGYPAARIGDRTAHCGGSGEIKTGSGNVIIGNGQGRLFKEAAQTHAPFVQNIAADRQREHEIWQQNMQYLEEKGISWADNSSKLPEDKPAMPRSLTLEDKKRTLAERQSLIKKGREQSEKLTGENKDKLNAAADRLELNNRAVERARLAQDVYKAPGEQQPPIGWKRLSNDPKDLPLGLQDAVWDHPKSGFRAALYESEIDGSKVLVFRGTANMAGWKNNGQQGLGYESEQYDRAMKLASKMEKVYPNGFETAGHSLGGGLTTAGSIVTETPGYSFNGSGLHPNTIKPYDKTRADGAQLIHAYHVKGEVLTSGQARALNAVYTPVGTGVRYARQANPISIYKAARGEKPLNLQPVVVYDAVGISHELPAVNENGEPVSIIKANPVDRHGMDYVINGIEKQKTDDKNAITKAI
jgi:uncharacterized Zn-binding protein involved in type VI secretion